MRNEGDVIETNGAENIPFVRMEAGTNLIGGQPFSLENMKDVRKVCDEHGLLLILDASLLSDNLYFIKEREENCKNMSIRALLVNLLIFRISFISQLVNWEVHAAVQFAQIIKTFI